LHLPRPNGVFTVENVSFGYEGGRPVLDRIDLVIAGGVCGLIGRNGSGKSALLKLMQGLYRPTSGRVLLDGADVAQFTRAELAGWCGYVPQECVLFAGTVRDNIAHRLPHASDQEIVRAATLAGVHELIIDLADGYGTAIGEAGRKLSAGQRQCTAGKARRSWRESRGWECRHPCRTAAAAPVPPGGSTRRARAPVGRWSGRSAAAACCG